MEERKEDSEQIYKLSCLYLIHCRIGEFILRLPFSSLYPVCSASYFIFQRHTHYLHTLVCKRQFKAAYIHFGDTAEPETQATIARRRTLFKHKVTLNFLMALFGELKISLRCHFTISIINSSLLIPCWKSNHPLLKLFNLTLQLNSAQVRMASIHSRHSLWFYGLNYQLINNQLRGMVTICSSIKFSQLKVVHSVGSSRIIGFLNSVAVVLGRHRRDYRVACLDLIVDDDD